MKVSETINTGTERVILVGLPGSGKSTLAAKLAKNYNLIWIDLENSLSILRKLPASMQERINVIPIPDSASFPVAADTLLNLFKTGKGSICRTHGKYECAFCKRDKKEFDLIDFNTLTPNDIVILDSASQLSSSILSHVMKDKQVSAKPDWDDWGAVRRHTEYFASQFQAARFNLIVIAHAVEAVLEDNKKKLVAQFGSDKMSATFNKNFDHVIYCEFVNKKFKAYSSACHSGGIITRSRTDFEIEKLPEPDLDTLFKKTQVQIVKEVIKEETKNGTVNSVTESGITSSVNNFNIPPTNNSTVPVTQPVNNPNNEPLATQEIKNAGQLAALEKLKALRASRGSN